MAINVPHRGHNHINMILKFVLVNFHRSVPLFLMCELPITSLSNYAHLAFVSIIICILCKININKKYFILFLHNAKILASEGSGEVWINLKKKLFRA